MTATATNATHNPVAANYTPYYEDEAQECDRLQRCLQQQIEDCFTTISRIQQITEEARYPSGREGGSNERGGELGLSPVAPSRTAKIACNISMNAARSQTWIESLSAPPLL